MDKNNIVFPGDQVSTSEELLPGEGTFEEDGIIRASRLGIFSIDEKHKKALVKPLTSIPTEIKKNDIVLAQVNSVKSNMVIAEVLHVIGKKRPISGDTNGTLRVSEISMSYVKEPSTEFNIGDIIRAKVIQVVPSLQLTTKDKNLGVIKANCSNCRQILYKKGNILECNNCGNKEKRKLAIDYGEYDINKF
ncbi:MAG: exosome complex RNA-binding protein Csl4 [Candidatus Thermoplasmatota archaeon]|jgi:exosome complex component CSL4|nr:exosome complex RNA-binding protein Csl4 [Candidatus Thermoplasmatota archaeon]